MTPYFELVNNNGVTIVDDQYTCLALRQWGTSWGSGSPSFNYPPGGVTIQDITYSGGTAPVVAIYKNCPPNRLDMGAGVLGRAYNASTNTWTFRVMVLDRYGQDYSFTYYVFDQPLPLSPGMMGVELMDGASRCVFSSRNHQMITRQYASSLPSGKWAHTFSAGVGVQNDTYDISGPNGPIWVDRYRIGVAAWGCTPTSVYYASRSYSQDNSRESRTPTGMESNSSSGSFLVDVSRIV